LSELGTRFEKKELFGQLPLQVDGFKDIHESLEATTAQGEIETLTAGVQSRSCQEVSVPNSTDIVLALTTISLTANFGICLRSKCQ